MNLKIQLSGAYLRILWLSMAFSALASGQMLSGSVPGEPLLFFSQTDQSDGTILPKWQNARTGQTEVLPTNHQWFALPVPSQCHKGFCTLYFTAPISRGIECTDRDGGELACQQSGSNILQPAFKGVSPGTIIHLFPKVDNPESGHQYIVLTAKKEKPDSSEPVLKSAPSPPLFIDTDSGGLFPEPILPVVPLLSCRGDDVHFTFYPLLSEPVLPAYLLSLIRGEWFEAPPGFIILLDHCDSDADEISEFISVSFSESFAESPFVRKIKTHLSYLESEQKLADFSTVFAYREKRDMTTGRTEYQVYDNGQWREASHEEFLMLRGLRHIEELDRIFGIDTSGPYGYDTPNNSAYRALMESFIREEQRESRLKTQKRPSEKAKTPANNPSAHRFTPRMLGGGGGGTAVSTPAPSATPTIVPASTTAAATAVMPPTPAPTVPEIVIEKVSPEQGKTQNEKQGEDQNTPAASSAPAPLSQQAATKVKVNGIWFTVEEQIKEKHKCIKCHSLLDESVTQDDDANRVHKNCYNGKDEKFIDKAFCRDDLAGLHFTCTVCDSFTNTPYLSRASNNRWDNNAAKHAESHRQEVSCAECGFISSAADYDGQKADLKRHRPGYCLTLCEACGFNYEKEEKEIHRNKCPRRTIKCCLPGCEKYIACADYAEHLRGERKTAGNSELQCPCCEQVKGKIATMLAHVRSCPESEQYNCELVDEQGMACHTCFFDADKYLDHALSLHPKDYDNALEQRDGTPDPKIASLVKAMRAVDQPVRKELTLTSEEYSEVLYKISELSQRVAKLTQESWHLRDNYEKGRAEMKQSMLELEREVSTTRSQAIVPAWMGKAGNQNSHGLNNENMNTLTITKQLEELDGKVTHLSIIFDEVRLRQDVLDVKTTNGILIWKIPDLRRRYRDAVDRRTISLYSPPFYTSPHGYRMCIRTYLNGDGIGKSTHVSLFFVVMRSEHDNLLSWPFKQSVRFTLINQKNPVASITEAFIPDSKSPSFHKPQNDMNVASGFPKFARQTVLKDEGFTWGDMIFIKCQVDLAGLSHP